MGYCLPNGELRIKTTCVELSELFNHIRNEREKILSASLFNITKNH